MIDAFVTNLDPTAEDGLQQKIITDIRTLGKDCKWDVYTSAKPSKSDIFINRAKPVSLSSDGTAIRIGSRLFMSSKHESVSPNHFDVPELSLYVDHIERQGRFMFVTSRQKIMDVPKNDDKEANAATKPGQDDKPNKKGPTSSPDSSVATDSDDSNPSSEAESEALSAYESWSEASTDYSESEILRDTRTQYAPTPGDKKQGSGNGTSSDSEDGSSSASNASNDSDTSGSDDESVAAPNMRYAHVMDDEEEEEAIYGMLWGSDPDEPEFDGDEFNGAFASDSDEEDAYNGTRADSASQSDSEDEEEVKQEDDTKKQDKTANKTNEANAIKDDQCTTGPEVKNAISTDENEATRSQLSETKDKDETNALTEGKEEEEPEAIGELVSQLHVYDLSSTPPERVLRFRRDTSQLLRDSPLAVHPTKSLVIWPLGDNNILFADYKYNTYFIRKFRVSRFWSQHVSISCRFSSGGQYLHVAALEMRRNLPVKPKKDKGKKESNKNKTENKEEQRKMKEEKEQPECDLLVSTYRLSERKTTRCPPLLVHQVRLPLGRIYLARGLPTFTWVPEEVFVTYGMSEELKVFKISLFKTEPLRNGNPMPSIHVPNTPITIGELDARREIYFLPPCAMERRARVVITKQQPALKKFAASEKMTETRPEGEALKLEDTQIPCDSSVTMDNTCASQEAQDLTSDDGHYRNIIRYLNVEEDLKGWRSADNTLLGQSVLGDGVGQMDVDMVKFDQTDDCECCDD